MGQGRKWVIYGRGTAKHKQGQGKGRKGEKNWKFTKFRGEKHENHKKTQIYATWETEIAKSEYVTR